MSKLPRFKLQRSCSLSPRAQHVPVLSVSLSGVSLLVLASCGEPLVDPQELTSLRVLGARVDADDDPGRAGIGPGEPATLTWLVASDGAETAEAGVVLCQAEPTTVGEPFCADKPFATLNDTVESGVDATFSFNLPEDLRPGEDWLAVFGVCQDETPQFDRKSGHFLCGGDLALSAFYRGTVPDGSDDAGNRNPELDDDELTFAGKPWPVTEPALLPDDDCADSALPSVGVGDTQPIRFELGGEDRQDLGDAADAYGATPTESLFFTHLITSAGLERAYSAIESEAVPARFVVEYQPPEQERPPATGRVVDFYLIVRDERGGVDWTRRQLCLQR